MLDFTRKKLVLSIGDDGAVLSYFKNGSLQKRLFAASPNAIEAEDFKDLCQENKNAVLYILVDSLDQSYVQHQIPPVSSLMVNNLVRRKLEKDYAPSDVKAALKLGRAKVGRKDWSFLFVSVHNVPPFSEWIDMALDLPNIFGGIYMLPIETGPMLYSLDKAVETGKNGKSSQWKILITHNRVGGVRQIIFQNHKLVLTRMSQPVGNSTPDIIAGNIEQDLVNTIEFIRRIGFDESDGFDVFVVASSEVKQFLDPAKLQANTTIMLTPFELSQKLHLKGSAEESDKYADVVIASSFASRKSHILKVNTAYSRKLDNIYLILKLEKVFLAGILAIFLVMAGYFGINILSLKKQVALLEESKKKTSNKLAAVKEESAAFPVEIGKMLDSLSFYRMLTNNNMMPLDFLDKIAAIRPAKVRAKTITINLEDKPDNKAQPATLKANLAIEVMNPEKRIEQVIETTNGFTASLNAALPEYEIKYNNLPGTGKGDINTSPSASDSVAFSIEIKGPRSKEPPKPEVKKTPPKPAVKK